MHLCTPGQAMMHAQLDANYDTIAPIKNRLHEVHSHCMCSWYLYVTTEMVVHGIGPALSVHPRHCGISTHHKSPGGISTQAKRHVHIILTPAMQQQARSMIAAARQQAMANSKQSMQLNDNEIAM